MVANRKKITYINLKHLNEMSSDTGMKEKPKRKWQHNKQSEKEADSACHLKPKTIPLGVIETRLKTAL